MRLFLGIPLAESVRAQLTQPTARLRSAAPNLRWSASDSWHITLQFLGNTTPAQYECLIPRLAQLRFVPVLIQLSSLGIFDRAGVFYVGIELTAELIELQQRIVAATTPCGFEPESRPYHPHITLARSKGQGRPREIRVLRPHIERQPNFPSFLAGEFLLYESHLSSAGSTYEVRHRFSG